MREEFRAKLAAALGLEPDADDDAIASAAKALRSRSRIAAALGVAVDADAETMATAARGLVEASKRAVREVRLSPADKVAIDATVAASSDPQADLRERQVLDAFGLPTARTPAPVVIQRGTNPADWTPKQAQDAMLRRLGFHTGTEAPPKGDVVYFPSPNDTSEFNEATGEWVEKKPFKEIP